ncbi:MAG TPA: phytanoyl-CoA dioxygenase family protein [Sphingomicrobium sp.]|nr:phytanoyl-CoA dioxygenase family protein [Sphingomicrobium sp.]
MLKLERGGAQLFPNALSLEELGGLQRLLPIATGPGERIYGNSQLAVWLTDGPVSAIVRDGLGDAAIPVRAILFDKTTTTNWALGWHQDRTIVVRERIDTPGFRHWNVKAGAVHVEPPFGLIDRMVTARIHIDPVSEDNSPLLIAPGSHRRGRIPEERIEAVVDQCGSTACLAAAGDVWLYRTAILHPSAPTARDGGRRVLQVDYSADELEDGLQWLGVG